MFKIKLAKDAATLQKPSHHQSTQIKSFLIYGKKLTCIVLLSQRLEPCGSLSLHCNTALTLYYIVHL